MTQQNSYGYIDILPEVVASYIDTVHSGTGYAPSKVDEEAAVVIQERMLQERDTHTVHKALRLRMSA